MPQVPIPSGYLFSLGLLGFWDSQVIGSRSLHSFDTRTEQARQAVGLCHKKIRKELVNYSDFAKKLRLFPKLSAGAP